MNALIELFLNLIVYEFRMIKWELLKFPELVEP
jgi:hypothetical protein